MPTLDESLPIEPQLSGHASDVNGALCVEKCATSAASFSHLQRLNFAASSEPRVALPPV